jgi:hypothetical protein
MVDKPEKPSLSPSELAAFWSLPLAPVAMLADVLGVTPQSIGRLEFPVYRIGGKLFVRPLDIGHGFRALQPFVGEVTK